MTLPWDQLTYLTISVIKKLTFSITIVFSDNKKCRHHRLHFVLRLTGANWTTCTPTIIDHFTTSISYRPIWCKQPQISMEFSYDQELRRHATFNDKAWSGSSKETYFDLFIVQIMQMRACCLQCYSSSFIYSDLRLHCSHISTNKLYIVNTPSPFGLISHSIHFYQ